MGPVVSVPLTWCHIRRAARASRFQRHPIDRERVVAVVRADRRARTRWHRSC